MLTLPNPSQNGRRGGRRSPLSAFAINRDGAARPVPSIRGRVELRPAVWAAPGVLSAQGWKRRTLRGMDQWEKVPEGRARLGAHKKVQRCDPLAAPPKALLMGEGFGFHLRRIL